MKTIKFNTGRKYTAEGQFIVATLHDDNVITFMDHSRGIDGQFKVSDPGLFSQAIIMGAYDHHEYDNTSRSWADGMTRNGINAR